MAGTLTAEGANKVMLLRQLGTQASKGTRAAVSLLGAARIMNSERRISGPEFYLQ